MACVQENSVHWDTKLTKIQNDVISSYEVPGLHITAPILHTYTNIHTYIQVNFLSERRNQHFLIIFLQ
jgi:hypothetical protein